MADFSVSEHAVEDAGWVMVFDGTETGPQQIRVKDTTGQRFYVRAAQLSCGTATRVAIWDGTTSNPPGATPAKIFGRIPHADGSTNTGLSQGSVVFDPPLALGDATSINVDASAQGFYSGIVQGYTGT